MAILVTDMMGDALVKGHAKGEILFLSNPINLWSEFDPMTGMVFDSVTGKEHAASNRMLVITALKGATAGGAITESIRHRTAPAAIILTARDAAIVIASVIGDILYNVELPIFHVTSEQVGMFANGTYCELVGNQAKIY